MTLTTQGPRGVRFGGFRLDLRTGELQKDKYRIRLQDKPFQILSALLERPGDLVTREELRQRLWPSDTFVDFEHSLNNAVNRLRETLHDSSESPRFIETLPKLGYRFITTVEPVQESTESLTTPGNNEPTSPVPRRRLRATVLASAALLLLAIAAGVWWRTATAPTISRRVMLAVLPFQNLSGDPELEYVADGFTEEMISQLGRWNPEEMGIIARTSSMLYKNSDKSVKAVGQELGVDYVLEGSVRSATGRWRISVQLIRVRDQTHLWAQDFNRPQGEIVGLQEDVAAAISRQIEVKLGRVEEARRANARRVSPAAHEAYLRGRLLWYTRTTEGMRKSVDYFQRAIELQPDYALAYAGLADAYTLLSSYAVVSSQEVASLARAAALKAVELDEASTEAHTALASVYDEFDWDFLAAQREYKRAVELSPSYAVARDWHATVLIRLGMFAEAEAELRQAQELDPVSVLLIGRLCGLLGITKPDEALAQCQKARELGPQHPTLFLHFSTAYYRNGMKPEAVAEARRLVEMAGDNPSYRAWLGFYLAWGGQQAEARQILRELLALSKKQWVSDYAIATIHSGLGEKDAAFERLEKALRARESWITYLKPDCRIDPLRNDPRYADLLRRVGLPTTRGGRASGL
jgi:TolB-like protein/DNA-binding winged helix-turn-helix (wHTH) protein/Tfp pilus assembly protein PilF